MKAQDADPVKRWRSISDWYAESAAASNWNFLTPMIGLTAWVAEQPFAAPLFPSTSHQWLCVSLHRGYKTEYPFFSCVVRPDGQFECELWEGVSRNRNKRLVPFEQSHEVFAEYVTLLHSI